MKKAHAPDSPRRRYDGQGKRLAQKNATRLALVATARRLFAEKGYHETGTTEIVAAAGVTQGALYHHFADKEDLFLAVFMAVQRDVPQISAAASGTAGKTDPWTKFRRGVHAFLTAAPAHRDLQRILLLDGPVVLGWKRWREIQQSHGLGAVVAALDKAMAAGVLPALPVQQTGHMILAMIDEAALLIVNGENRPAKIRAIADTVDVLLSGMALTRSAMARARR